jgi:hypothetical protein
MEDLGRTLSKFVSDQEVDQALKVAAQEIVEDVIRDRVEFEVKTALRECIRASSDRRKPIAEGVEEAINASMDRILSSAGELGLDALRMKEMKWRQHWEESFESGEWRRRVPGKEIIRRFDGAHVGVKWQQLRHLILAQMRNSGFVPLGMARVIHAIEAADAE